jgi:hypothetical protein
MFDNTHILQWQKSTVGAEVNLNESDAEKTIWRRFVCRSVLTYAVAIQIHDRTELLDGMAADRALRQQELALQREKDNASIAFMKQLGEAVGWREWGDVNEIDRYLVNTNARAKK